MYYWNSYFSIYSTLQLIDCLIDHSNSFSSLIKAQTKEISEKKFQEKRIRGSCMGSLENKNMAPVVAEDGLYVQDAANVGENFFEKQKLLKYLIFYYFSTFNFEIYNCHC